MTRAFEILEHAMLLPRKREKPIRILQKGFVRAPWVMCELKDCA